MNEAVNELNLQNASRNSIEDIFSNVNEMFENFSFVFQETESDLRKLELVASLFDHITIECVNDIARIADEPRCDD